MAGDFDAPAVVEEDVDILIIGGGMGACGAAYEAGAWRAAARQAGVDLRIKLVDKAAIERSGAVAQGLAAIGTYLGQNDPADYARMVSDDQMGLCRDDLTYDLGRHVDDSVHLFEEWGLPICKEPGDEDRPLAAGGRPVRSGKWQILVHGESCKPLVAAAARQALGPECIAEHVFIVRLVNDRDDPNRISGAVGFSLRDHRVHVYRCKACLLAAGGGAGIFRPRADGEGAGRTWGPAWGSGSTYAMAAAAGAELTMMESRLVPLGFKDTYGPLGAWFQRLMAKAVNAAGEDYQATPAAQAQLAPYGPYGAAAVTPSCLRNHLLLQELQEGRGPVYLDGFSALGRLAENMTPKEIKRLEADVWGQSLAQCATQVGLWAGENSAPEKRNSELMPSEPCLLGSQAGGCGLWVSGPADLGAPRTEDHPEADTIPAHLPAGWHWGYRCMTTVAGLFTAADGVGASGHKYSSGSHAEGRIAAKAMIAYALDHRDRPPELDTGVADLVAEVWQPVRTYREHQHASSATAINPHYITPRMLQLRLQKIMDDYVGGLSTWYRTNARMLDLAAAKLAVLKEDAAALCARDRHELLRAWENRHRLLAAEAHVKHLQFRAESRYPGCCYRTDCAGLNDADWKCFVNSIYDRATGTWTLFKRQHVDLVDKARG